MSFVPGTPGRGWSKYRKTHALVAEQMLGRPLMAGEVVHHIDGDKLNYGEENLYVTDNSGHRSVHHSLMQVGYDLVRRGLVLFDRDQSEYKAHPKLRELLGQPGEVYQQPSLSGDTEEGSTTRRETLAVDKSPKSAGAEAVASV